MLCVDNFHCIALKKEYFALIDDFILLVAMIK